MDMAFCADLESADPKTEVAAAIAEADIVISTGCVGYIGSPTFNRIMALAREGRPDWVASFVLRMFPYDRIAATLARYGLETEKFHGATFVQRRFANRQEMESVVRAVECAASIRAAMKPTVFITPICIFRGQRARSSVSRCSSSSMS